MIKENDILIRVDLELKEKIKKKAGMLGLSVSAYVRMILKREINK